jgi:hypothetical protein
MDSDRLVGRSMDRIAGTLEVEMSSLETVVASVKDGAHSFRYIRKATGLRLNDDQFNELIKENGRRLRFTRIRRTDADGNRIEPGWPGVKLLATAVM